MSADQPFVLLISPHRWKPSYAPYALEHLAHHLCEAGFRTAIVDFNFGKAPRREIGNFISSEQPVAIGITVRNFDTAFLCEHPVFFPLGIRRLIRWMRKLPAFADAARRPKIVTGGISFSAAPEPFMRYLRPDYGVAGTNERSFVTLVKSLAEGDDPSDTPGLLWWRNGEVEQNPPVPEEAGLPAIRRDLFDHSGYYRSGLGAHYSWGSVETARGCTQGCGYCIEPESKIGRLRKKSPDAVLEEVRFLQEQGLNWIWFTDSEFNLDLDHAKSICLRLKENLDGKISWGAYFHPTPFDRELVELLTGSGCRAMGIDVGHGVDGMMRRLGKSFTLSDLERTAGLLKDSGIAVKYSVLLGGPDETQETIARGLGNLARLGVIVELGVGLRVYPSTPFAREIQGLSRSEKKQCLFGKVHNNPNFLEPIFYFSPHVADDYAAIVEDATSGHGKFLVPKMYQVDRVEVGDWRGIRPGYSRRRSNDLLMKEEGEGASSEGASFD